MNYQELTKKAREYDEINNDGGEGYNPYTEKLEMLENEVDVKPETTKGKIDKLYKRIEVECGSIVREWDSENVDKLQADLYKEIEELEAQKDMEFKAIWTAEITKSRRAEYNNFIISNNLQKQTPENLRKIYEYTQTLSWVVNDLKKAVKLYNN